MEDIARIGCLSGKYSRIAMNHYVDAKEQAEKMLQEGISEADLYGAQYLFVDNALIAITFAAMALESFFNDYAARKFGDKFYYDNFEMLRPTGKFQLLARFGLNIELDKGKRLFQLVDKLFKQRNGYVHNKSKDGHGAGMTEEELNYIEENFQEETGHTALKEEIKQDLKTVSDAIAAICEVAKFFDRHDEESHAMFFLSLSGINLFEGDYKRNQVLQEFGIPIPG